MLCTTTNIHKSSWCMRKKKRLQMTVVDVLRPASAGQDTCDLVKAYDRRQVLFLILNDPTKTIQRRCKVMCSV